MNQVLTKGIFALCIIVLTAGCAKLEVKEPGGFAVVIEKSGLFESKSKPYKAVSPEGMLYGVRLVDNYPPKDLQFWSETLKSHLQKEGYQIVGEGKEFETSDSPGIIFEWAVPHSRQTYIFLTAIVVSDSKIAIAEAAGEHTVFSKHRENLLESLKTISF